MEERTRTLSILGSTGSIGTQALDVVQKLGYQVAALTANRNVSLLERQIRHFRPAYAAMMDEQAAADLKIRVADLSTEIGVGMEGVCRAAALPGATMILNALVGMVGLRPTLCAIEAGKPLALANKEALVAGGDLVMSAAADKGVAILPVDSEHSAIFQCLQAAPPNRAVKKLILTASGGPFFGKTREELASVTKKQALQHPNWSMGAKITIDSATMMNKGLEVIEAVHLFGLPADQIEIVVHRESIVHSMVEFDDHSVLAQLGVPDMRIPIQYALTYPERYPSPAMELDLAEAGPLSFFKPDLHTFECLQACKEAIKKGGLAPTAANGANEQAVALFLADQIPFLRIGELVCAALERYGAGSADSLAAIMEADREAREFVLRSVSV